MRLDFNVLWVDDQPERIDAQITGITAHMEAEGFDFVARKCASIDEVKAFLASDVFSDEIDLILVDWDLGSNLQGQDAIVEIRRSVRYKDVVFYSAQESPDRLRQLAYEAKLEGIFCASREELVQEVMGVFDSLIKKILDLDHTRGIVMGATSDIDYMVNACLVAIHARLDATAQKVLLEEIAEFVGKNSEAVQKRAEGLKTATTIEAFIESHQIFTANDRLRILSRQLKLPALQEQASLRPSVVTYLGSVIKPRNVLGHQVLVPEGRPAAVVDLNGNEVSLNEMRELRRMLLRLRKDFRALLNGLT